MKNRCKCDDYSSLRAVAREVETAGSCRVHGDEAARANSEVGGGGCTGIRSKVQKHLSLRFAPC
jgi:hypothetical protein